MTPPTTPQHRPTMHRVLLWGAIVALVAVGGCSSGRSDGSGSAARQSTGGVVQSGAVHSGTSTGTPATVSGTLGGRVLKKGVCAWVETGSGRVEVWVREKYGQVFFFETDDSFGGIRAFDPAVPNGVGDPLFGPGQRVTVTGTTYTSTPECGKYGVDATQPITGG